MATDKKFNLTIAPLWENKFGYMSMAITDEVFDALQQVEKGGKLVFKVLKEESRKSEKSPGGYLEYLSKEEVQAYAKMNGAMKGKMASSRTVKRTPPTTDDAL